MAAALSRALRADGGSVEPLVGRWSPAVGPINTELLDTSAWSRARLADPQWQVCRARYNAVLPNPPLVALERTKRFTGDVPVSYLLNPGTAPYVGYTDNYENLRRAGLPPSLQPSGAPGVATGQQFFVKMSYLFRF